MSVQHQTINIIDSFLINKLITHNKHIPVVSKNHKPLKRVLLKDILNLSMSRFHGMPKNNVQLNVRNKENVSSESYPNKTCLNTLTNTREIVTHQKTLLEKSSSNQTLKSNLSSGRPKRDVQFKVGNKENVPSEEKHTNTMEMATHKKTLLEKSSWNQTLKSNLSMPRLLGRSKMDMQVEVPSASRYLKSNQTCLKKHTSKKELTTHKKPLLEKSSLSQTLRRSNRLINKEYITKIENTDKYQPKVIISPLQRKSRTSNKKKELIRSINDRSPSKEINYLSVSDKNKFDENKNRRSNRLFSQKNKIQDLILAHNDKSINSYKIKQQNDANNVNDIKKKKKTINGRNLKEKNTICSNSVKENQISEVSNQTSIVKNSLPQVKTLILDNEPQEKKKAKRGTLGFMKDRHHFLKKLQTTETPPDYYEVCKTKKNKALDDLLKMDENETLEIRTPKSKEKLIQVTHMTPRTAVLHQWEQMISYPVSTPKDASKLTLEDEQDALKVVYHHLKYNPSNKRKYTERRPIENQDGNAKKMPKIHKDVDYFNDLDEKEKRLLSQAPYQADLNETSFDDYFNESV